MFCRSVTLLAFLLCVDDEIARACVCVERGAGAGGGGGDVSTLVENQARIGDAPSLCGSIFATSRSRALSFGMSVIAALVSPKPSPRFEDSFQKYIRIVRMRRLEFWM